MISPKKVASKQEKPVLGQYKTGTNTPTFERKMKLIVIICIPLQVVIHLTSIFSSCENFDLSEFERIHPGKTKLYEVEALLGKGTPISSTTQTARYQWKNCEGAHIGATVSPENVVQQKDQDGLE